MSAIATILGAIFGRQKDKEEQYKMDTLSRERLMQQPAQVQQGQQSTAIGQVAGQQMPPQQQSGQGFQNGMNKVSTIANILQSLKGASGGGQNQGSYQMQMRRR